MHSKLCIKINEIVNKIILAGDKFMPKRHLKQPVFTYSSCWSFTKNKEIIQKFKDTGDMSYIYKIELYKTCFQHDMAYVDFKDLASRTTFDKVLRGKALILLKILNLMDIKQDLLLWFTNFFMKS